ncbi:MAG: hypothetical protein ACTSWY_01085 [Promethearchaeota archaeon]
MVCIRDRFVGPRGLFDPLYIPDHLFDREKEEGYLKGLLNDAFSDNFPLSLSVYGHRGSGKTVLVNKTVSSIFGKHIDMTENESKNELKILSLLVNCEGKDTNQIIFSILNYLANKMNYDIPPADILKSKTSNLWNLLKMLTSKLNDTQMLLFLDSVEHINPKVINKIMDSALSESFMVINSFNIPQCSPFLMNFKSPDFKIDMDSYSNGTLLEISRDRCEISIRNPVEDDITKYIVDLVCQFDKKNPGSCIRLLRELYPLLDQNQVVSSSQIRDIARYQFEGFSIDELSVADFISESTIIERIFLDNICTYFNQSDEFYIPFKDLSDYYKISCETIEYDSSNREFHSILKRLQNISLLMPTVINTSDSNRSLLKHGQFQDEFLCESKFQSVLPISKDHYFLTVPADLLNCMLDVAFGKY